MASKGEPIKWITVKGRHLPVYADGTIGIGFEHEKESNVDLVKEFELKKEEYANTPFNQVAKRNELREWLIKNQNAYHTQKKAEDVSKINPTNLQVFKENSNQLTKALEEAKKQNALEMHYTDATGQTYTYYWDGAKFTRDKINQDMAKKYGKKSGVYEASFKKPANWSDEIAKSSIESKNSRYDTSKASGKIGGKITTRKQLDDETQKYRAQGYSIITFGNNRRELEKNGKIIVLEIKK